ncbi:MAG TPA: DinB family protein [Candidatus Koribacter sp.]|jgi:uncharacterized damage-inducible protein DinB
MKRFPAVLVLFLAISGTLFAQNTLPKGVFQGYTPEWDHASEQIIALAEAIPADKYSWRPAAGVRSTSEVFMHIAGANYWMIDHIGVKAPADAKLGEFKNVTNKEDVIRWLKRSLDATKQAYAAETPASLQRKVHVEDRDVTVDDVYLRALVHINEHMGQLVAYARMNGITPPWSQ